MTHSVHYDVLVLPLYLAGRKLLGRFFNPSVIKTVINNVVFVCFFVFIADVCW